MMDTNTYTLNKEYKNARRAVITALIAFIAFTTLYLIILPTEAKAFNMDELQTLIEESTATAEEVVAIEANTDVNSNTFSEDTKAYGNKVLAIAEKINSKRPQIEGIANDINAETTQYVENAQQAGFFEGWSVKSFINAVTSAANGEEIYSQNDLANKALQIAGLQDPASPIMKVVIQGIRSVLGLTFVSFLFSLAKSRINRQY